MVSLCLHFSLEHADISFSLYLPLCLFHFVPCFLLPCSSLLHPFWVFFSFCKFLWGISASPSFLFSQFISLCLFHFCLSFLSFSLSVYLSVVFFFFFFFNSHHIPERVQHDRLALTIKIVVLNGPRLPSNSVPCIPMNIQCTPEKMDNCSRAPIMMMLWMSAVCSKYHRCLPETIFVQRSQSHHQSARDTMAEEINAKRFSPKLNYTLYEKSWYANKEKSTLWMSTYFELQINM